jgi:uncharacterized protein DUF4136
MRTHRWSWALAAALLASCAGYGAPDEVVFGEAVYTQGKPDFDFKTLAPGAQPKYAIVEQMVVVDGTTNPPQETLPSAIAQTIRTNMNQLGYVEVPATGTPESQIDAADVAIQAALLKGTAAVYYPGYWCDYWYYYSCYYDYYYAGSYKYGSVILQMTDVRLFAPGTPPKGQKLPPLWAGAVYGVQTSSANDITRAQSGLNDAFSKSPYLDVNP